MRIDTELNINIAKAVKELRELTGAGLLECKKALVLCGGDKQRALVELTKKRGGPAEPEPEVVN